jgi:uncharacterized heparinase superfamily protein
LWYKVKSPFQQYLKYGGKYNHASLHPVIFRCAEIIPSKGKYLGNNTFLFLHCPHTFTDRVDWGFTSQGKLWNYNLQYFDYLHDDTINDEEKQRWLQDFSKGILNRKITVEPYPVSLRLINWILYYTRTGYHSIEFEKAIKFQVDFLERNLEHHIQANHLLENYFALTIAGLAFRDEHLVNDYLAAIEGQLQEQVFADGGHYERSWMYHSIILGKVLLLIDTISQSTWARINEGPLREVAARMLGWLRAFQLDNNSLACINDSTEGITPGPQVYFKVGGQLNIKCPEAKLQESGFRKMRIPDMEIVADVGNISPSYQPGHYHSGMLGFCLNYKNDKIIVDTGTSTYQVSERRMLERMTISHNTVTLNQEDQSEIWSAFRVGRRAKLIILNDRFDEVVAKHDGYEKSYGVIHQRGFTSKKQTLLITDEMQQTGHVRKNHEIIAHFHFNHSVALTQSGDFAIHAAGSLQIIFEGADRVVIDEYKQAVGFNRLVTAKKTKSFF